MAHGCVRQAPEILLPARSSCCIAVVEFVHSAGKVPASCSKKINAIWERGLSARAVIPYLVVGQVQRRDVLKAWKREPCWTDCTCSTCQLKAQITSV